VLTKSEAELVLRVRETLEALWDCTCPDMGPDERCERCVTLVGLDLLLARSDR
jgi:hypothetical protein